MRLAQKLSSAILSLRKKEKIRVRQPLECALIATSNNAINDGVKKAKEIVLAETNLKNIKIIDESSELLSKKAKANFKVLGPKFGSKIKKVSEAIAALGSKQINLLESKGEIKLALGKLISINDVEITSKEIQGYSVASNEDFSVALDVKITEELENEGWLENLSTEFKI